ncbi:hypothetical protein NIES4072_26920 [Nostoc commune NIES-4072]|uniref:Uncharacterized protein n=1 Tax=Nostoc commune NIES-4072 TaxID=2005467 RepID=A0A2R5FJS8_NOSCO|nr:hypothetical protein NIES4070_63820 [Nostoc commune HK-02]GBG19026.1 hypothetical protein NIES4072_26920 [Nostoc commune NIES-4072]
MQTRAYVVALMTNLFFLSVLISEYLPVKYSEVLSKYLKFYDLKVAMANRTMLLITKGFY